MRIFLHVVFLFFTFLSYAQRPIIGGFHVYYGNLHNHCDISDGSGSCNDAYNYAKNVTHQDFFSLADHCNQISASEWTLLKNTANAYNEDGVFTAFWGFEWSSSSLYGHVTVLGTDDYCQALSFNYNTFTKLCNWLNARNGIAFFNHPGRENDVGLEFNHFSSAPTEKFVGMELWNKGLGFNTWYYNDGYYSNDGGLGFYDEALSRGWWIGASGSEDNHDGDWGWREAKFAILSHELTRHHIWKALLLRRFYSTLDRNIEMSFKINGHEMGSRLKPGSYEGEIRLHDADNENFVKVELLKKGVVVQTFNMLQNRPVIPITITANDGDYYYIRVHQQDGDQAISSPIFFSENFENNNLPVVSITSPYNNTNLPIGEIAITADAFDINGEVKRVTFFVNDVLVGNDTVSPYSVVFQADTMGTYKIKSMAFDDLGAASSSEEITVEITNTAGKNNIINTDETPEIMIMQSNGKYFLMINGNHSQDYEVYNIQGSLIYEGTALPRQKILLEMDNNPAGLYIARLVNSQKSAVVKFIITK